MVIGDPDVINAILRDRPDGFRRWSEIESITAETVGRSPGVFAAEGDDWRRARRLAVTALNTNHLQRYFESSTPAPERLHRRLERGGARRARARDRRDALTSFTVDVTSALAFGRDLNTLERGDDELQDHIHRSSSTTTNRRAACIPFPLLALGEAAGRPCRSTARWRSCVRAVVSLHGRGARADRRPPRAARGAGELPRGHDRRAGKGRHLRRRGDPRQRLHPAAGGRGHHLAHDGLDDLALLGDDARRAGALGRGGAGGTRRASLYPSATRPSTRFAYGEARPARGDAAQVGRADRLRRAARRHRGRRDRDARRDQVLLLTRQAGLRDVDRAPEFRPERWLDDATAAPRPTRRRSSPSAPARASARAATSPSSRRRRRWR